MYKLDELMIVRFISFRRRVVFINKHPPIIRYENYGNSFRIIMVLVAPGPDPIKKIPRKSMLCSHSLWLLQIFNQ